ncbi:MAG: OmpA family protein [Flavobacteriales bacterium]|nr:OmpA family protein [Flavobacteriales bacterium]
MKPIYILTIFLLCLLSVRAQEKLKTPKADEYYASLNYPMAIQLYEKSAEKSKEKKKELTTESINKLANSYYFTNDYSKAKVWYRKLYRVQGNSMKESDFIRYISCMRSSGEDKMANEILKDYYKDNALRLKMLSFQKNELDSLENTIENIKNVGINSANSDFSPSFYKNEIIFSSSRKLDNDGNLYEWNNQPYLNLYRTYRNEQTGELNDVRAFTALNSGFHDATLIFSQKDNSVYFSRNQLTQKDKLSTDDKGNSHVSIMRGTLSGDEIMDIQSLEFNASTYSCSHPALTPDGKHLIFASDKPGGYGESDLYIVQVNPDGSTTTPVNLGENINTAGREMFPFFSGDTLFFASDGHFGLGGLDVFQSVMGGETNYSVPVNLGAPINSTQDDFSYIYDNKTRTGYFSSNRDGGKGDDDLYWFKIKEIPQWVEFSGLVLSEADRTAIPEANVQVFDMFNELVSDTIADDQGNFLLDLPCNEQFTIVFSKENYSKEAVKLSTPKKSDINDDNEILLTNFNALVEKEGDREKIKVEPIYFEYAKWDITDQAIVELNKVLFAMEKFPEMTIKIESHTDSRGADRYNLELSDKRAKSTREYLISQGIDSSRIESAIGYGETRLKNRCRNGVRCSEEQHYENRRSDFVIISK